MRRMLSATVLALCRPRALQGLAVAVAVVGACLVILAGTRGTLAYFSDHGTSSANAFRAGYWADISATIDLKPETIDLKSAGQPVTCYIELPSGQRVQDIEVGSIQLENTVPAQPRPTKIGDYDGDAVPDLMVKFDRVAVNTLLEGRSGDVTLKVTGTLAGGGNFEGTDSMRVTHSPNAPTGLQVTDGETGDSLNLAWQVPTEPDIVAAAPAAYTFKVHRATKPGGPHGAVAATNSTSYADGGLTADTRYYYVVTALDASGLESEPSAEVSGVPTTKAVPATATPTPTDTPAPASASPSTPTSTPTPAEAVAPSEAPTATPSSTP